MENQENKIVNEETIQPKLIKRNDFGLIDGVTYHFDENGFVNWRKMVKPEYLVVNRQNFEKRGETPPDSIEGAQDKDLLILLQAIKELCWIRGYKSITYSVVSPSAESVITTCQIHWIGNFETENRDIVFSGIGDANFSNCTGFGRQFLGPVSENRAFVRAVRNFLKVHVVGKDEITENTIQETSSSNGDKPTQELEKLMKQKKVSWELIKNKLCQENVPGADTFTDVASLPKNVMFNLIERLQKKKVNK